MGWKSKAVFPFAKHITRKLKDEDSRPTFYQEKIFKQLIAKAKTTKFGRDFSFESINSYDEYKERLPLLRYSDIEHYIELIQQGENDVLWPGQPKYFVGTSGTTSGVKYIPLTTDSLPYHFGSARNATFQFCIDHNLQEIFDGKMIFLSGSPELYKKGVINTGRLSGIVNNEIPQWLRSNQIPTYKTNCIIDWEEKIKQIILESHDQNMTMISGITPWIIMYAEYLLDYTGKQNLKELFPNLKLIIHGGVNFGPYKEKLTNLVGKGIKYMETYPASEGYIASQVADEQGLRLNVNGGIFFEFIAANEIDTAGKRIPLEEIELGVNYAIILNNNAGFFSYILGDTVQFVGKDPYRLIVTGRLSQFISAFGEHVIVSEVERAIEQTCKSTGVKISEFSVAPNISSDQNGKSFHEWFVEFESIGFDLEKFAITLDENMKQGNFHYDNLVNGKVISPLKIVPIKKDGFRKYMKSIGKLGGQNKVPKLANNRKHADLLMQQKI